jgi:hypothetical protein
LPLNSIFTISHLEIDHSSSLWVFARSLPIQTLP